MGCASSTSKAWEDDHTASWTPLTMHLSWTREAKEWLTGDDAKDYDVLARLQNGEISNADFDASFGRLHMSVTNPAGEKLMTLEGGWRADNKDVTKTFPMDTTIFTSTGEQYTAVCKVRRPNSWSWTLANYTSKPVELGFGFPTPTKLEWTASEGGETPLPVTEALPKKIYTHRLSDRVRTWSGANAACPKGEAQAADRANDLLSVASTKADKKSRSSKATTDFVVRLSMPSDRLRKYTPQELALLLAIETDSYWSLGAQENVFGITEVRHDLDTVAAYAYSAGVAG